MQTETQVAIVTSLFAGATLAWWFASRNNNKSSAEKDNELATRLINYTQTNNVAGLREMLNNKNEMKKLLTVADTDNNTPLIMALRNGYEEAARILVNEFGQNVEAINNDGWNCFLSACFGGSMELLQLVHTKMNIKDIKEEEIMNSKNNDGWTGLHISSAKGFQEIVKFLVDHGANVNLKNGAGHTPVLLSACNGFLEIVKYLVEHGADTTLKTEKLESPLFMSIRGNRKEIAEYLLSLPAADLHYINSSTLTGATALHAAARMGMESTVLDLLAKGADINAQERDGSSPLHASIVQNKPEIARLLVERGADINTKTRFGVTPLHDASFYGRPQIVKLLLEHGADTTQRDNDGLTPLHIICTASTSNRGNSKDGDHVAAIRELLDHGADVNTLDEGNSNPLYIATFAGEMGQKLVPVLLEYGANYTNENFQGWTPLHAAYSSLGNAETAKIIEEHAKIHNPDFLASFNPNKPRDLKKRKNKINLGPGIFGENGPSLEAVAEMIKSEKIKNVVVLLGAGISVSAGIPDFRSPNSGIYSQETCNKYGLANPSAAFDIGAIRKDPVPFYHLVKDIFYPVTTGHFKPTKTHKFLTLLKEKGVLCRVYTQNIDGLEYIAGLEDKDVVEAHGSFKEAYCMKCRKNADMDAFWKAVGSEKVPICSSCGDTVRPNVTFFGEPLPSRFFENSMQDLRAADLLIVMGTSLKVYPFAALVNDVSSTTPRLLINRDEVGPFKGCAVNRQDTTEDKDKEGENEMTEDEKRRDEEERKSGRDLAWLGECDDGVQQLINLLGWEL